MFAFSRWQEKMARRARRGWYIESRAFPVATLARRAARADRSRQREG